ncbi:type II toxin-antitoxin system prevent-host-death family antitoxin [Acidobacteria bacterium AH-259-L09]|nr:type II toxin-antitoxin system prevent-host-death family antitoxin [Acidobacteria bacterium AH-259-L09]
MKRSKYSRAKRGQTGTQANIARVKAHFSRYLRLVRAGEEVTVTDCDRPVARLVPFREERSGLRIHQATKPSSHLAKVLELPPLKSAGKTDSLSLLREDREKR